MAAESTNLEHQTPVAVESTNLEHQYSASVLKLTSFYEALQGGSVIELQNNSLELVDFDYQYLHADFDCLRSITDSLDYY